jgi:hypothetical protein
MLHDSYMAKALLQLYSGLVTTSCKGLTRASWQRPSNCFMAKAFQQLHGKGLPIASWQRPSNSFMAKAFQQLHGKCL